MPSVYCTACGEGNPEGARFCSQCGRPLIRGQGGSAADTTSTISLGDIVLDDVSVSRRHAEFYRQGGRFTVRDVGSLNGTYVNRERLEEAALSGGDEGQIGKVRLVFRLGPRSQAEYGGGGSQVGG